MGANGSPGAHRRLWARPEDLPCGSRPPNPFPAMSAPPGALIAPGGHRRVPVATPEPRLEGFPNGGRHWVPAPPGPSDALASPTQP